VRALLRALPAIIRTIRGLATDPVLPKATKIALAAAVLYLVSPIDLVPDFIPVLGYLDDLLLVPAGIFLTVRLIPDGLMAEFRAEAAKQDGFPVSRTGAIVIVLLWVTALTVTTWWLGQLLNRPTTQLPNSPIRVSIVVLSSSRTPVRGHRRCGDRTQRPFEGGFRETRCGSGNRR